MKTMTTLLTSGYHSTEMSERFEGNFLSSLLMGLGLLLLILSIIVFIIIDFAFKTQGGNKPNWFFRTFKLVPLLRLDKRYKLLKKLEETGWLQHIFSVMVIFLLSSVILVTCGVINRTDHLEENLKQKYNIESIEWQKRDKSEPYEPYAVNTPMKEKVITAAGTFDVIISQNPETFEPTLTSPTTGWEMKELRK